jgi:hypothetical protein
MKSIFQKLSIVALFFVAFACKDDFEDDIVHDSIPTTPVIFTGAFTVGFNPYYTVPMGVPAGSTTITLTLSIPADNARSFKSIDKIVGGASGINAGSLATGVNLLAAPAAATVTVNGKQAVVTMTVAQYNSKVTGATSQIPLTLGTAFSPASPPTFTVPYNERAFMFSVTLDDNTIIIPEQVRIRVTY